MAFSSEVDTGSRKKTRRNKRFGEGTGAKASDNSEAPQRATASRLVSTTPSLASSGNDMREMIQATRVREDIFDRSIDVQVLRLRRKLTIDPNAPSVHTAAIFVI
jgi:two-component system, OmpR family, response regulator